jgi:nucleotidyltransferase substrate binding protein (TIGR01987 family)
MSIRLQQRTENFRKSFKLLSDALEINTPTVTERAGIIQFYELTFELGWKCLKDYFESKGLDPKFPRDIIKQGIESEILSDGEKWLKALTDRNLTSHLYDESAAQQIENDIRNEYFPLIVELLSFLENEIQIG